MGSYSTDINFKKSLKVIETKTKASTRKKNLTPSQQLSTFHIWHVLTTPFAWICGPIDLCAMFCGVCLWYVLVCLSASCHFLSHNCRRPHRPDLPPTIPYHTTPYHTIPYHTCLISPHTPPTLTAPLQKKSQICVLANYCNIELVQRYPRIILQKNCHLTGQRQACSRITWLFGRLLGCHHAKNGLIHRKMGVDCPLVIQSETLYRTRLDSIAVSLFGNMTVEKEQKIPIIILILKRGPCLDQTRKEE